MVWDRGTPRAGGRAAARRRRAFLRLMLFIVVEGPIRELDREVSLQKRVLRHRDWAMNAEHLSGCGDAIDEAAIHPGRFPAFDNKRVEEPFGLDRADIGPSSSGEGVFNNARTDHDHSLGDSLRD